MRKTVIIGGVAGGATTAARLRRLDEQAQIVLFERGPHISYANCGLPYYIGGVIQERDRLFVQTPERFSARFRIDIRLQSEVTRLDLAERRVEVRNLKTGETYTEGYDSLVLSPGAEPIRPPIPGIDLPGIFTLRSVQDADRITQFIGRRRPRRALVVGAGFIGLEMAENLHHRGMGVTVVELAAQVMAPLDFEMAAEVHQHLRAKKVQLHLNEAVTSFSEEGRRLAAHLAGGRSLSADLVVLGIGVRPDAALAKAAGLRIGERGGIVVDEHLRTSDPHVYALGDAIEFPSPITGRSLPVYLAGPANKQARIVADNIVGGDTRVYRGSIATAIAKVFDLTVAATGAAEKTLTAAGIPCLSSITHSGSHAGYYPGATQATLKIVFSPSDGRLLGAQMVGGEGVDKRIDVIATVLTAGGTIYDLQEVEHAYAPPYSSGKDPVNIAGFAAENILQGLVRTVQWSDLREGRTPADAVLLDVREPDEVSRGRIEGAVNVPLHSLRDRLAELPKGRPIIVYCAAGLRAYLACRILSQSGFAEVYNLSGGYQTYAVASAE